MDVSTKNRVGRIAKLNGFVQIVTRLSTFTG
jgi:hypothetical protein